MSRVCILASNEATSLWPGGRTKKKRIVCHTFPYGKDGAKLMQGLTGQWKGWSGCGLVLIHGQIADAWIGEQKKGSVSKYGYILGLLGFPKINSLTYGFTSELCQD